MGLGSCVERQCGSDGVGDAAQPGQRQLKPRRPRPADGQMQHQPAGRAGQPTGQGQQGPGQRLGRHQFPAGAQPDGGDPAQQVVARVAIRSQAALAANLPEGQCRSPTPALRSRIASSTVAWRRWSWSSSTAVPTRSVTKAWERQLGNSSAWPPTKRVRRTISTRARRHSTMWEMYKPSRRSSAPLSPGSVSRSYSTRMASLYSGQGQRRLSRSGWEVDIVHGGSAD